MERLDFSPVKTLTLPVVISLGSNSVFWVISRARQKVIKSQNEQFIGEGDERQCLC